MSTRYVFTGTNQNSKASHKINLGNGFYTGIKAKILRLLKDGKTYSREQIDNHYKGQHNEHSYCGALHYLETRKIIVSDSKKIGYDNREVKVYSLATTRIKSR